MENLYAHPHGDDSDLDTDFSIHDSREIGLLGFDGGEGKGFAGLDAELGVVPRTLDLAVLDFSVAQRRITMTTGVVNDKVLAIEVENGQGREVIWLYAKRSTSFDFIGRAEGEKCHDVFQ